MHPCSTRTRSRTPSVRSQMAGGGNENRSLIDSLDGTATSRLPAEPKPYALVRGKRGCCRRRTRLNAQNSSESEMHACSLVPRSVSVPVTYAVSRELAVQIRSKAEFSTRGRHFAIRGGCLQHVVWAFAKISWFIDEGFRVYILEVSHVRSFWGPSLSLSLSALGKNDKD